MVDATCTKNFTIFHVIIDCISIFSAILDNAAIYLAEPIIAIEIAYYAFEQNNMPSCTLLCPKYAPRKLYLHCSIKVCSSSVSVLSNAVIVLLLLLYSFTVSSTEGLTATCVWIILTY